MSLGIVAEASFAFLRYLILYFTKRNYALGLNKEY